MRMQNRLGFALSLAVVLGALVQCIFSSISGDNQDAHGDMHIHVTTTPINETFKSLSSENILFTYIGGYNVLPINEFTYLVLFLSIFVSILSYKYYSQEKSPTLSVFVLALICVLFFSEQICTYMAVVRLYSSKNNNEMMYDVDVLGNHAYSFEFDVGNSTVRTAFQIGSDLTWRSILDINVGLLFSSAACFLLIIAFFLFHFFYLDLVEQVKILDKASEYYEHFFQSSQIGLKSVQSSYNLLKQRVFRPKVVKVKTEADHHFKEIELVEVYTIDDLKLATAEALHIDVESIGRVLKDGDTLISDERDIQRLCTGDKLVVSISTTS